MNKRLNLMCSILALFCFVSLYMPIVAPRYPAEKYYPGAEDYNKEYFYMDDSYCAREYWDITRYVFSNKSVVGRVILSITQALLLYWALISVRGEAGRIGLAVAALNLCVSGFVIIRMLLGMWSCRWVVLAVLVVDAMAAVGMAAWQSTLRPPAKK